MTKKALSIVILVLVLVLGGCKQAEQPIGETTDQGEGTMFLPLEVGEWYDNSLDMYTAEFIKPLHETEQEDAVVGGAVQYILGREKAAVFKKHLFQEVGNCWDEVKTVTENGEETSHRLAFWEGKLNQAWAVGSIYNSDHYLMMNPERDESGRILYKFFETDGTMQLLRSFYVDGLDIETYEFPNQILVDAEGYIHMITWRESDNTSHYYVASPDGAILTEVQKQIAPKVSPALFYLYNGQVGIYMDKELLLADAGSGEARVLADLKEEYLSCILWDEWTLLYADPIGLHRSSLSGEDKETLYTWKNHGITFSEINAMQVSEEREISLLYTSHEEVNYMKLVPTTEEVPILEIEFAVASSSGQKYRAAVAEFNKTYPAWHIEMETYEMSDTSLLTKLMAGDGPQLLDTGLVGFQDHADLWEPMDGFYHQLGLDEGLVPQILEMGKIEDTIYGAVTDFRITTMVAFAETSDAWDYAAFLDYLDKDNTATKSIYNPVNGSDGYSFAHLFYHNLDETFLYNAQDCTTRFDSEDFRKLIRLAKYYTESSNQANVEDFLQGAAPCAVVCIRQPGDLACLRILGEGQLRYIGFPTQTGPVHYLEGADPLCVRTNATAEEKQLAFTFLSYLLSYEVQKEQDSIYTQWSVREDVLSEQMKGMDENTVPCLIGFPQFPLGDRVNLSEDYDTLCELLTNAKTRRYAPRELNRILSEQVDAYLDGIISEETLREQLTNRVQLYLKEQ